MSVMRYKHTMSSDAVIDPVTAELDSINIRLNNLYNVAALHGIMIILTFIAAIVMRYV